MGKIVHALLSKKSPPVLPKKMPRQKPKRLGAATRGSVGRELRVFVAPGTRPKASALKPTTETTTTATSQEASTTTTTTTTTTTKATAEADDDDEHIRFFNGAIEWEEANGYPKRQFRYLLEDLRSVASGSNFSLRFF